MGHVLSRVWVVRTVEISDDSTSDDGSSDSLSVSASCITQARDDRLSGDRNSVFVLPDDLILKLVLCGAWGVVVVGEIVFIYNVGGHV